MIRYLATLSNTLICLLAMHAPSAAILTFNSSDNDPTNISTTRNAWLSASGITIPEHLADFESGFTDGQNISGVTGLFGGGLVIVDTSTAGAANIEGTAGGIGGSNPVGSFAVEQNERQFLELDFSARPVDYVAFQDIDHTGTSLIIHFVGGATVNFGLDSTAVNGDSAEFFGVFRNDMPRITLIQMDSSGDGRWGIDNIEYGAPVPLPGAVWLHGSAIAGLTGWSRHRST